MHGSGALATTSAPPPPAAVAATATAEPISVDNGSRNGDADAPAAAAEDGDSAPATAVALPPGEGRWTMNDGAADLAERGVELEMGGARLPAPSSSPFLLGEGAGGRRSRRRGRKRNRQEEWTEASKAEVSAGLDCCSCSVPDASRGVAARERHVGCRTLAASRSSVALRTYGFTRVPKSPVDLVKATSRVTCLGESAKGPKAGSKI